MKKFYLQLLLCLFVISNYATAQVTLSGTSYTELFDNIGSGLPAGWTVRTPATASSLGTAQALTVAATAWNNTTGAFKNFASADGLTGAATAAQQSASTDRALGVRQTGAFGDPGAAFTLQLANTAGFSNFTLTFDLQSLDQSAAVTRTATWLVQYGIGASPSSFTTVATVPPTLQTGNVTFSNTNVSVNFGSALDNQAGDVWIRIVTLAATTGSNNRPSTGIDDFVLSYSPSGPDVTPPTASTLTPPDNSTGVAAASTASISFSEPIQKGAAGTITVKDASNNTVQTIDVTTAAVTVSGSTASFNLSLSPATSYYIQVSAGAFEDLAGNDYAGISDNVSWNFSTSGVLNTLLNANFNTCTSTLTDGFTQFSAVGTVTWACTTFGRDPNNLPSGSAPNGVQINGFTGGTNVPNEDWLISPALNLTGTTYPLLSFWSRTRFNGDPLELKVSTDYPGSGDPRNYTWTDLNGRFPSQTSDVWTESANINLSAYKQANVYIAFVYNSSDEDGARWTLDDIRVDNSAVPPPASLTTSSTDVQFSYTASGATSDKTFTLTPNDITSDVTLTVAGPFQLSKDGSSFSSSINYTVAEANNIAKTVYVRFAPTQNAQNYSDSVIITTTGANAKVYVKGTSLDPATTLEVVNWNVEWFGSTSMGPTNDAQQEQNVRTILQNIGADIYGLVEVVSEARLASVVATMPGYSYVITNYGSHTNPNAPAPMPLADAQKLAFVYKTSLFSNVSTTALLSVGINTAADVSTTSYNNWASGRFPYMLTADVTLNGVTKTMRFVLLHAKANTSPTTESYNRRKGGADELRNLLNSTYGSDNIIILGDYNDDLDVTITDGINPPTTSYVAFTSDNSNYGYATLPLSQAGKKSTVSYNDVIDHVMFSNELGSSYISSSATILTDAANLVTNYASTTSDHYPVFTRYRFSVSAPLPVNLEYFSAQKQNKSVELRWATAQEVNSKEFVIERSANGRDFTPLTKVTAAGNSAQSHAYSVVDDKPLAGSNYYRLRSVDKDGQSTVSRIIRVVFDKQVVVTYAPNPAKSTLVINVIEAKEPVTVQLMDAQGKAVRYRLSPAGNNQPVIFNLAGLSKGLYVLKMTTSQSVQAEKVVIE